MKANLSLDGLPLCPDCNHGMSHESAGNRDTETMGGFEVQYFRCDTCQQGYELIDNYGEKNLYPS